MNTVYEVQEILDQAILNNQPHYLIKWKNFGHQSDTWEPLSELSNIIEYLQDWLTKRRNKQNSARKDAKGQSFSSIKSFLYGGQLLSKKSMIKSQYLKEIATCDQICDKYINQQIKLKQSDREDIFAERRKRRPFPKQRQLIEDKRSIKQQQSSNVSDQKEQVNHKRSNEHFKIVGEIDTSKIQRIVSCFNWNDNRCLEVELADGKRWNMVQKDLRVARPQLVVDFYQTNQIPF